MLDGAVFVAGESGEEVYLATLKGKFSSVNKKEFKSQIVYKTVG